MREYEYRRYEAGASPAWTPLRFPGQYFDEETDLFENWNRYYDPSVGRYLQPEPLLQEPGFLKRASYEGRSTPVYSYAANNPINFADQNGREIVPAADCPKAIKAIVRTFKDSVARSKNCPCLELLHDWNLDVIITSAENNVDLVCKGDVFLPAGETKKVCGDGDPDTKEITLATVGPPSCSKGSAKTILHELLHASGPGRGHDNLGPDKNKFWNSLERCITEDGKLVQN